MNNIKTDVFNAGEQISIYRNGVNEWVNANLFLNRKFQEFKTSILQESLELNKPSETLDNLKGDKDDQILIWSGNTWIVSDKLIHPGTFTFKPKTGVMSYETIENGHYEMVLFGSDEMSGLTNTKQGDVLYFDGSYWINSGTGLTYRDDILNVSSLNVIDNFKVGDLNISSRDKIPLLITKYDSGDPITNESNFCINIYDKNIKIYADGEWRLLLSW